ncbi:hypothetical protein GF340_02215 [Candidatus Peregrinibacteria bacterium]|nr:hypothetical protein [Candidatus Peregrinibacteria bacterium]
MQTTKFLEEIIALENKVRKKAQVGENEPIPVLLSNLKKENKISKPTYENFFKLWDLRNKLYSSPNLPNRVSLNVYPLLANLLHNTELKQHD